MKKLFLAFAALLGMNSIAKADITDGAFGINQIFDVQYYWSGNTLNASNFIAPYDMNFQHPTVGAGQYFKFFNSTTNPGTYGLGLYNADGTLAQVVHNTGTLQAIGPDALFYVGSGFFGTVISTGAGYSYGQSASFSNMDTTVTSSEASSYSWASTTPLAAGQTAAAPTPTPTPTPSPTPSSSFPVVNGDFATGTLGPWTAGGGTGTQSSTAYSDVGVGVAIVQEMTSYSAGGSPYQWTVKPPTGTYMASIQPKNISTPGVNTFNDMIADLGLSAASKSEIIAAMTATGNGLPTTAAWIKQDITLSSGQTFKMAWQYISTDYVPFNDGSLTSLVNKTGTIVATVNGEQKEYALLGFTNPGTGNYSVGSYGATGWQQAEYVANQAGTYTIGFAAFNLSDTALSPILFVTQNVGTTLNFTAPFGAIAPNPGSTAPDTSSGGGTTPTPPPTPPTPPAPTVVSTAPGTPIVTSSSINGVPVTTSVTNTNMVNGVDVNGNPTVTTYFTVTTTTVTPTTTTTVTTPVTVTTYSDGSSVSTNGTPVTTTNTTTTTTTNTTDPAVQAVATSVTTSGPAVLSAHSVIYWPSSTEQFVSYSTQKAGKYTFVNKNTVTVVTQPTTVTNVTTTPITTTVNTVDGQGNPVGSTASTINQNVTDVYNETLYSAMSENAGESYNANAVGDIIKISRTNPFLVDPLSQTDANWINPSFNYYKVNGGYSVGGVTGGKQHTIGNHTIGVAFNATQGQSSGYLNSKASTNNNYAATAYMLSKLPYAWIKGSVGVATNTIAASTMLPTIGLGSSVKGQQNIFYSDLTAYAPTTYKGFRPLIGATLVNSQLSDFQTFGSPIVGSSLPKSKTTQVNPYVGLRYEYSDGVSVEARATQTQDFGTVAGVKATVKKKINEKAYINLTVGYDKGKNYNNTYGMVGIVFKF